MSKYHVCQISSVQKFVILSISSVTQCQHQIDLKYVFWYPKKYQEYFPVYGFQCPKLFPSENYFLVPYTLETNDRNFSNIRKVDLYKDISQLPLMHSEQRGMIMKLGKHQRSKQRCQDICWKVHNPAQSFLLCTYTMHEVRTQSTRFYWLVPQYEVDNYNCVLCRVKAKKENKNMQQRTLSSFITIPL